jgi:hypothetical protein
MQMEAARKRCAVLGASKLQNPIFSADHLQIGIGKGHVSPFYTENLGDLIGSNGPRGRGEGAGGRKFKQRHPFQN